MFTFQNFDLSDVNSSPEPLEKLYGIFRQTLNPDLTEEEFNQYLFSAHPDSLEMTFIHAEDELAGFCTAAAYPRRCGQKKVIILRSAFGLRTEYKQGRFPLHGLFYKYMRYKLTHLFTPVYVAGFMANPLMYAMICKYTRRCYPRRDLPVSEKAKALKQTVLDSMGMEEEKPFVLKIHFQVKFNGDDLRRFHASNDEDVKYFLAINPGYNQQVGVLVIVPVTVGNMAYTFGKHLTRRFRKRLATFRANVAGTGKREWAHT